MTFYATGLASQALLGNQNNRPPDYTLLYVGLGLAALFTIGLIVYLYIQAQKVPEGGTVFDKDRTLATGTKRGPQFFPAIKIETKTCQQEFGSPLANPKFSNAFWDAVGDRCYSCPPDMKVNVLPSVLDKNKCSKPGKTIFDPEITQAATPLRPGVGPAGLTVPDKSKGEFFVGDQIWKCPINTIRNTNDYDNKIDGPHACIGKCEKLYPATDDSTEPKNQGVAFYDVFQANCWSCPTGFNRTAAGVNAPNACIK